MENYIRYYFYQPQPDGSYVISNNAGQASYWHSTEAIASAVLGKPQLCCRSGSSALCGPVTAMDSASLQSFLSECLPPHSNCAGEYGCQQCSELGFYFCRRPKAA